MKSQNISFKLRRSGFLSSSYSVVRLSILASQAKDSGSNPDGSIRSLLQIPQYSHAYNNFQFEKVTILENHQMFEIVETEFESANGGVFGNY